jgi:hypothetical protein
MLAEHVSFAIAGQHVFLPRGKEQLTLLLGELQVPVHARGELLCRTAQQAGLHNTQD